MNPLELDRAVAPEQDRARAFAQDHSPGRLGERLDRWLASEQAPLAISVAKQPVGFLRADH